MTNRPRRGRGARPAGGFVFISVLQLCRAWEAYQRRAVRLVDLRAWFACQEMAARRCRLAQGRDAAFTVAELHRLVGGAGGRHTRAALRRLEAAGLLRWTGGELAFLEEPAGTRRPPGLERMLARIANRRRKVPVPRRLLRLLADGATRAVIATALGHLLRCLYYRGGSCSARGTCKSSWVAEVFGVDVRTVKAARRRLVGLGWLRIEATPQWRLNRYGASVTVDLAWSRAGARPAPRRQPSPVRGSPPPPPTSRHRIATP